MAGCVRSQAIFPASSPSQRISFENPSCTSKQQISCSSLRYTIHAWHSPVSVIWSRSYVYSRFLISTRLDMSLHIFGLVFGKVTTFFNSDNIPYNTVKLKHLHLPHKLLHILVINPLCNLKIFFPLSISSTLIMPLTESFRELITPTVSSSSPVYTRTVSFSQTP